MYKCIKLYIRILHLPRRSHDRYFLVNSNAITIEKRLGLGNSSTETLLPYVNACECSCLAKFTISIKSPLSVELACCSLIIGMTSLQKIVWLLRVQNELIVVFTIGCIFSLSSASHRKPTFIFELQFFLTIYYSEWSANFHCCVLWYH